MGMDAEVNIWVGFKDDVDFDELVEQIPKDFFDEDGDAHWSTHARNSLVEKYGVYLQYFYCSEEQVGFGVPILSHDWDYGVVPFDVKDVSERIEHATKCLQKLCNICEIDEEIGVWCQTDYS